MNSPTVLGGVLPVMLMLLPKYYPSTSAFFGGRMSAECVNLPLFENEYK